MNKPPDPQQAQNREQSNQTLADNPFKLNKNVYAELYQHHYESQIKTIRDESLFKEERFICSPQGPTIQVLQQNQDLSLSHEDQNIKKPVSETRELLNFCANNYLGLSSHPDIIKAAHIGIEERGFGMSSVRFICGTQDIHRTLELSLSTFLKMEDTILFSSCFDANGALFETLLGPEDVIFSDRLVHASLIDGMRLCKATRHVYEHSDLTQLEDLLKIKTGRVRMIITDGVFSMDGDMARLDEICSLAQQYSALVAVDDSHATGFIGPTGRGTHEHFKVMDQIDIITTTFGKALGGATGGCISGRKELISLLRQRGRPYLFSNALMPAVVNATLKTISLISENTEKRDHLEKLASFWRKGLTQLGFDLKPGNTPIVPIMLYEATLAQNFSRSLYEEGVFAIGFFYPVVPKGQARIRTQISSAMSFEQLEKALIIFEKVGKKLKVIK